MYFRELDIRRSYTSMGDENIATSFLVPVLKCTRCYKRSVGYFSSSVLQPILDGVVSLARNNGTIQLIASPNLSENDIEAIIVAINKICSTGKQIYSEECVRFAKNKLDKERNLLESENVLNQVVRGVQD